MWFSYETRPIQSNEACLNPYVYKKLNSLQTIKSLTRDKSSIIITLYVDDVKVHYKLSEGLEIQKDFENIYSDTTFNDEFIKFLGKEYKIKHETIHLNHEYIKNITPVFENINTNTSNLPKLIPTEIKSEEYKTEILKITGTIL